MPLLSAEKRRPLAGGGSVWVKGHATLAAAVKEAETRALLASGTNGTSRTEEPFLHETEGSELSFPF